MAFEKEALTPFLRNCFAAAKTQSYFLTIHRCQFSNEKFQTKTGPRKIQEFGSSLRRWICTRTVGDIV